MLAAGALVLLMPAVAPAAVKAPEAVVEDYHSVMLSVMKRAQELGFDGRVERLEPVIRETFDLHFMARFAVGKYWDRMAPEQQERLVEAFSDFSVALFANRFNDYSGQRFETLDKKKTQRNDMLIFTKIVKADGDDVKINYLLRRDDDETKNSEEPWQVIDVFLTGAISELATRRAEYTSVASKHGVDYLIEAINRKTKELAME